MSIMIESFLCFGDFPVDLAKTSLGRTKNVSLLEKKTPCFCQSSPLLPVLHSTNLNVNKT